MSVSATSEVSCVTQDLTEYLQKMLCTGCLYVPSIFLLCTVLFLIELLVSNTSGLLGVTSISRSNVTQSSIHVQRGACSDLAF